MFRSVGEQLRQARQDMGMTLDQAAQATRIRKYYLEALENDQRSLLPSPVQGRGFLRLYAGHLKLPIDPLLAAWDGKELPETPAQTESIPVAPVKPPVPQAELNAQPGLSQPVDETSQSESSAQPEPLSGSAAIFYEIGQTLTLQRQGLGLSRAEVERYTKLRQHYIAALEEGRLADIPSPVQGRGMLSNYATFLNLDEEKMLLRFAEGLQARRVERLPSPTPANLFTTKKRPAQQAPAWRRILTPDLVFGVSLAAIILFFILWTAARIDTLQHSQAVPTAPAIAQMLLTSAATVTPSPGNQSTSLSPATGKESQIENPDTGAGSQPTTTPVNLNPNASTPNPGLPANITNAQGSQSGLTPTILPMNKDPLQVYIVAQQRAWLRVIADNKLKFLGRVVPGNAYAFSGTKQIELLTGNGAGLQVFFNQQNLGTLGSMGEVIGLIFSSAGITTPTPAFTSTPGPTKPATITPLPSPSPTVTSTVTPLVP